jgi:hypothetical protein
MPIFKREQSDKEKAASKRGRSARRKGHSHEREIVNRLREVLPVGYNARRMLQGAGGRGLPDVEISNDSGALFHLECKRGKRPNIPKAFQQAWDDHKPGTVPAAVTKADRDHTLVTMRWQDFTEMLIPYLKSLEVEE